MGERRYPSLKVRGDGQELLLHVRGQGQQTGGAAPCPRSGSCMGTGGLRGATTCSRSGGAAVEEIHFLQVKELWLFFAGAALKRYPTPKVREIQVRW